MADTKTLIALKSTVGLGAIAPVHFSSLYAVEIIITGTVTALNIEIFGSISGSNMQSLAVRDVIANGKLLHIVDKGVNAMQAEITSITGGGQASIVLRAKV